MTSQTAASSLDAVLLHDLDTIQRDPLEGLPDATLAERLENRSPAEIWAILAEVPRLRRAMVFGHLPLAVQRQVAEAIPRETVADLVSAMSADERVDLMKELPDEVQDEIFPLLARAEREDIRKLAAYAEGTAGAIMTSAYVTLRPELTVAAALEKLRHEWPGKETIYYAYVINDRRQLVGLVSLRGLILARPSARVGDIMNPDVIFVRAGDSQEETAALIAKHDLIALPVVNGGDALVGIVTHDDALDVVTAEATEDMLRMAGTDAEEHPGASIFTSIRLRCPWLTVNLGTAMLASLVVSHFQDTLSRYIVLAAMMPIVAGLSGNAGTQTLAVTVRGIALGEIEAAAGWRTILREAGIGCVNGAVVGVVMGLVAFLWHGNPWLGLIMFLAMVANLLVAGLVGSGIPLTLKALRLDPALGSSIFITATTDVCGFSIFLSLATMLLPLLH
ncbi:MAG: magnesium transporter [Thermodesulfobacteriota bacterium]